MADSNAVPSSSAPEPSGQIIRILQNVLGERYPTLGKHVNNVARLSSGAASEVGLPDEETEALVQASFLHDVGKLSLPESLLAKPGPPDEGEWRLIRLHTIVGEQLLIAAGLRGRVLDFVRSSHERIDGSGYPDGLVGEEIPLGARIISVCDAYDAMTSIRPYRRGPEDERGCDAGADARVGHPVRLGRCRRASAAWCSEGATPRRLLRSMPACGQSTDLGALAPGLREGRGQGL